MLGTVFRTVFGVILLALLGVVGLIVVTLFLVKGVIKLTKWLFSDLKSDKKKGD